MRVISGVLDFLAVLGLIKSEDLSDYKMTKLLKGELIV